MCKIYEISGASPFSSGFESSEILCYNVYSLVQTMDCYQGGWVTEHSGYDYTCFL